MRLSAIDESSNTCVLSVHCQTRIIADFREMYPELRFDKNRSLLVDFKALSTPPVSHFLESALSYHSSDS